MKEKVATSKKSDSEIENVPQRSSVKKQIFVSLTILSILALVTTLTILMQEDIDLCWDRIYQKCPKQEF